MASPESLLDSLVTAGLPAVFSFSGPLFLHGYFPDGWVHIDHRASMVDITPEIGYFAQASVGVLP